ncbi:hypothetical protein [Candidatus Odyssella thessalonicensis]|uniref:hypothetical protein n=1 Tax=Candidatus Odyssella thessalonicensis TaxID=84647 RepID=UPI000496FCB8|nr:hypothetical protein [Candidatus Odyssella thessalonicensis]
MMVKFLSCFTLILLISFGYSEDFPPSKCFSLCKKDSCVSINGRAEACLSNCQSTPYYEHVKANCDILSDGTSVTPNSQQVASSLSQPLNHRSSNIESLKENIPPSYKVKPAVDIKKFIDNPRVIAKPLQIPLFILPPDIKQRISKSQGKLNASAIIPLLVARDLLPSLALKHELYTITIFNPGAFSGQVFKAVLNNPANPFMLPTAFVIKELKWNSDKVRTRTTNTPMKELQDIEYIKASELLKFSSTDPASVYPDIKLPLQSFYFISPTPATLAADQKTYVSIMPLAEGSELLDLVYEEIIEPDSLLRLEEIMQRVGLALGSVHFGMALNQIKISMSNPQFDFSRFTTATHGDFHLGNIFFNETTHKVSFIDNASFANSLRAPADFMLDLYVFYLSLRNNTFDAPSSSAFNALITRFIRGYISAFPAAARKGLKTYITNLLRTLNYNQFIELTDYYNHIKAGLDGSPEPSILTTIFRNQELAQMEAILEHMANDPWILEERNYNSHAE